MRILRTMLRQKAVYWAPLSIDQEGQKTYSSPIEICCRWEDVAEEILDYNGNRIVSRAKVFVDRDVESLGVLLEGCLTDDVDTARPFFNTTAFEIRKFDRLPTLKANKLLRTAWL